MSNFVAPPASWRETSRLALAAGGSENEEKTPTAVDREEDAVPRSSTANEKVLKYTKEDPTALTSFRGLCPFPVFYKQQQAPLPLYESDGPSSPLSTTTGTTVQYDTLAKAKDHLTETRQSIGTGLINWLELVEEAPSAVGNQTMESQHEDSIMQKKAAMRNIQTRLNTLYEGADATLGLLVKQQLLEQLYRQREQKRGMLEGMRRQLERQHKKMRDISTRTLEPEEGDATPAQ